ncbi:hypothetical protein JKG68_25275 [Microvirga aerilata]|uniref:Uncharacterized protein n=1 Tax=Microvirga aerilata TaxID=670292 RepID=A0A936ZGA9_9HYPH|nr:hypothetical protein [Microvirga aerilata]MBL0407245.1 hypothetical protein [Microvirga aerilata]
MMDRNVHVADSARKLHRLKTVRGSASKRCSNLDSRTNTGIPRKRKPVAIPSNHEQLEKLERAARFMTKRRCDVSERERRRVEERWLDGLGYRERKYLHALNPWAGEIWASLLKSGYEQYQDDDPHFAVTILDNGWDLLINDFTYCEPRDLKCIIQQMRKQLQAAFRNASYLFMIDVSVERQARVHRNQRRFCLHLHGIVWLDRRKLRRAKRYFAGGHYKAPALRTKQMYDPEGWLKYASRDPRLGNHWYRAQLDFEERYNRYNEHLYSGQRQHLLRLFRNVTKPDLCIASGIGRKIKLYALRAAKDCSYRLPERESDWSVEFPDHRLRSRPLEEPEPDPYYFDD